MKWFFKLFDTKALFEVGIQLAFDALSKKKGKFYTFLTSTKTINTLEFLLNQLKLERLDQKPRTK